MAGRGREKETERETYKQTETEEQRYRQTETTIQQNIDCSRSLHSDHLLEDIFSVLQAKRFIHSTTTTTDYIFT